MNLNDLYNRLYAESIVRQNDTDYNNCDKGSTHSYIPYYEKILLKKKNDQVNILEIGVQGGICLLLWELYFVNAKNIVGLDIDTSRVQEKVINQSKTTKKITIVSGDATDRNVIDRLPHTYDVIVDDGSHRLNDQLSTFRLLHEKLNAGGIYIIEDIQNDGEAEFLKNSIPGSAIVDLRGAKGRYDDLLLVYTKGL
jgi:cephalosporin hydroxylase